jgi:hypothetical protein
MSENADGCTSLDILPTFFEGSGGGHHYASLFVSPRCGRGGLDLALMELSDIPHDEVLAEGSTRPEATAGRRATSPR